MKHDHQLSVLIIGITGSFGKSLALELLNRSIVQFPIHALVRSIEKAKTMFSPENQEKMVFIKGDIQNIDELRAAAPVTLDYVVHAVNYPYDQWDPFTRIALENSLQLASEKNARLLFPANVYSLKPVYDQPLSESHPFGPISKKGALRQIMEEIIENSNVKSLSVRAGDYFGPSLTNIQMDNIFRTSAIGKSVTWYGSIKSKRDWMFLPDLAKATVSLMEIKDLSDKERVHVSGIVVTGTDFMTALQSEAFKVNGGKKVGCNVTPWFVIKLAGLFNSLAREFYEMKYLKDHNLQLDDSKLKLLVPDFKLTPLEETLKLTLEAVKQENKAK